MVICVRKLGTGVALATVAIVGTQGCFGSDKGAGDGGVVFDAGGGLDGFADDGGPGTDAMAPVEAGADSAAPGIDAAMPEASTTPDAGHDAASEAGTFVSVQWAWMAGSNATNSAATYGALGTAAAGNTPGARYGGASWTGNAGTLWTFGGAPTGGSTHLNDLWKFDGTSWTWVSGSSTAGALGVYGTPGVAGMGNVPGARQFPGFWRDTAGNFWLFGGQGYGASGSSGDLNDLWKWDGATWTWMSGSSAAGAAASYGMPGVPAASNVPGGRERIASWTTGTTGWIFGGRDASGNDLGDLWKWDGTNWTWVSGSSAVNAKGAYVSKGKADPMNAPGARQDAVTWIDASGNLWLSGGYGYDGAGLASDLDDLWKFDGTSWTWVTGSSTGNTAATYGKLGVPAASNDPGSRENAVGWNDLQGNFWLMSGTSGHDVGELQDLWRFDGASWTWVAGSSTVNLNGTYGTPGAPAAGNTPGGRDSAIAWTAPDGHLWLYGGWGFDAVGGTGKDSDLGDLWRFMP